MSSLLEILNMPEVWATVLYLGGLACLLAWNSGKLKKPLRNLQKK
jgi:hypothetical protein